jgi:hypothetical protein
MSSGRGLARCWPGLAGHPIPVTAGDWRHGDQPVSIADIRKAGREGWKLDAAGVMRERRDAPVELD